MKFQPSEIAAVPKSLQWTTIISKCYSEGLQLTIQELFKYFICFLVNTRAVNF